MKLVELANEREAIAEPWPTPLPGQLQRSSSQASSVTAARKAGTYSGANSC